MSTSSRDSQNISEGGVYAAGSGEDIASPSSSGGSSSADERPIRTLVQFTGDSAQTSRALTVISSSPEPVRVVPTPASVNPPAPARNPSHFSGVIERGRPSPMVQETESTLTEADLERICKHYKIDRARFQPLLPLPGQTAYDPPRNYEAVYEDYFKSGFNLPVPEPVTRIMRAYRLRLPQIQPNGLKLIFCYILLLRLIDFPFNTTIFRALFACRSSHSWYYFSKRRTDIDFPFAINIPSSNKRWKEKFFYILRSELPSETIWRHGRIHNKWPGQEYRDEADRIRSVPIILDWRKVDSEIWAAADVPHSAVGDNFRPPSPDQITTIRGGHWSPLNLHYFQTSCQFLNFYPGCRRNGWPQIPS